MSRLTLAGILVALILAAVAVILLGPVAFAKSRNVIVGRPAPPPKSAKTLKRTWKSGPAETPPEIEIVSRRASFPSPVKPPSTSGEEQSTGRPAQNLSEPAVTARDRAIPNSPLRAKMAPPRGLSATSRPEMTTADGSVSRPTRLDPESRARAALSCLQDNPKARQAFYESLLRTADRVRTGQQETEKKEAPVCSTPPLK